MRRLVCILLALIFITISLNLATVPEEFEPAFGPILTPPNPEVHGSVSPPRFTELPRTRGTRSEGTEELLVLLVDFTDFGHQAENTQAKYQDLMFGTIPGSRSLHNYYDEVSYGNLNVVGNSSSWYTVPKTMRDYGEDSTTGVDDLNGPVYRLVTDVVLLADADIDFSQYDNDGDGVVDHLAVVHAGQGQESSVNTDMIWSHRWAVLDADPSIPGSQQLMVDGVQVYWYTMQSESSPVGVFAHEFGHDLGLVDLYDSDDDSPGIGSWGLMGGGAWLGSPVGSEPAHPCAWSKIELGWVVPFEVLTPLTAQVIPQIETSPVIYKLPIGESPAGEEYFLIENRQRVGFDSSLPGSGLLIWHVDESVDSNDDQFHRRVDLEEADEATGEDPTQMTDPWFDSEEGFNPASVPDSSSYAGVRTGWKVRNISQSDTNMTADITKEVEDDLAVRAVSVKSIAQIGETLTIRATIENRGTNNKTDFNVTMTVYGDTYETASELYNQTTTVSSLPSRTDTNLTWTYTPSSSGKTLFEVHVNLTNDEIPENNDRIVHATVNTVYFFDDVENGNTVWQTNSAGVVYRWEIVDETMSGGGSHSPTHSWKFGFFGEGPGTLPTQRLYLQSDNISIPGGSTAYFSFFHKFFLGELLERDGLGIRKTDTCRVLASIDGSAWTLLDTFEFSQRSWKLSLYDLSSDISVAGSNVRIRFDIDVKVIPKSGGWWIDDIAILESPPEEGLVLKVYENEDSVDPGRYASFLVKLINVGDATDSFQFGISALYQGWSAYLSQNASNVELVRDFEISLGRDEEAILFLTIETSQDSERGTRLETNLTAASMRDTDKQDVVTVVVIIREDPLIGVLLKVFYFGIIFLIVLVVVALVVSFLRDKKYKPKYPGY
ncbi:MAG: M6 family metalloprotease domain-containing protein [Thermoplasmata archaeon]